MVQTTDIAKGIDDGSINTTWPFYLLILSLSLLGSVLGSYIASYSKKRGEMRALKEEFEEVKRQLRETTRIASEIEAEISKGTWVDQQRWELRKELYLLLLEKLREAKYALGELLEARQGSFKGPSDERETYINERLKVSQKVSEEIKKAVEISGLLFLSNEALHVLKEYQNAEESRLEALSRIPDPYGDISAEATSWDGYLENEFKAASRAYDEIVKVAKEDLQIGK